MFQILEEFSGPVIFRFSFSQPILTFPVNKSRWTQNSPSIPIVISNYDRKSSMFAGASSSKRWSFQEKVFTSMGPQKLGPALWMYVCTLMGLQRDIVNHKENFFLCPRTYFLRRSNYPSHWFSGIRKYVRAHEKVLGFTFIYYLNFWKKQIQSELFKNETRIQIRKIPFLINFSCSHCISFFWMWTKL